MSTRCSLIGMDSQIQNDQAILKWRLPIGRFQLFRGDTAEIRLGQQMITKISQ